MGTWPDTFNEAPDGVRTVFTLVSGLTPINPLTFVGGLQTTSFSFAGSSATFGFAPATGESMQCYFLATGASTGTPGVTTLGAMRNTIRQRADLVNSTFITDPELNGWINSSAQELYDLLVQKYGDEYYVAAASTLVTTGLTDKFPLPSDHYKLLGVEWQNSSQWVEMPRFNFADRNRGGAGRRTNLRYRVMGNNIWIRDGYTVPSSGQTVRLWYVPRLSLLVNDSDALDGVSGWDEYVVTDCVIKCRAKGEEDPSIELALKAALTKRIEDAAENRDAGAPQTVTDVRGDYDFPSWERP